MEAQELQPDGARQALPTFRCPVCHTPWSRPLADEKCPSCGLDFLAAAGIPVLLRDRGAVEDQIAEAQRKGRAAWYSDAQSIQWTGPYRHHLRKRIAYVEGAIERFAPHTPTERVALDLGCGDGEHLTWLAAHAGVLYGSDYNLVRLERAAARRVATVFLADVTEYPMADESFDVVFCNHVLEHIPDAARALQELRRILRSDGIAVLGVPNEGAWFWQLAYRLEPHSRETTDHVHFFTATSLAALCVQNGLAVLETTPIGWGLPHWSLDARVRGSKLVDDGLEQVGRRFLRSQATSLYLILGRA